MKIELYPTWGPDKMIFFSIECICNKIALGHRGSPRSLHVYNKNKAFILLLQHTSYLEALEF